MTDAIKVQARYGILLRETDSWAGDFRDTSSGPGDSSRVVKVREVHTVIYPKDAD